jgi:hypothetical protein
LLVAVEFERKRCALGGGEVAALEGGEDDVLDLVCRGDDTDWDFFDLEFGGDRESLATVEHGALLVDLERFDDSAFADVGFERVARERRERWHMLIRVCV